MAANPVVVVEHGKIDIPDNLQHDPRFQDGARLQLVPLAQAEVSPELRRRAWDEFLKLGGIFADLDFDPNRELELDKQRELEAEARWLRD